MIAPRSFRTLLSGFRASRRGGQPILPARIAPETFQIPQTMAGLFMSSLHDDLNISNQNAQLQAFQQELARAKRVVVLTGAGISAESGISTFRGAGGFWGKYDVTQLATYPAFVDNPSLVWQFYAYRRETVLKSAPNPGHVALAAAEKILKSDKRKLTIVTQNIDGLHQRAGSKNVIEIHGSLFKTQCIKCGTVEENVTYPITPALVNPTLPDPDQPVDKIPEKDLPRCGECEGLLRPHVVWFGEPLDTAVLDAVYSELDACDLCLVVGTSSVVYPAAMFAPHVAERGVSVAEFNLEFTQGAMTSNYLFIGPSGLTLPNALRPITDKQAPHIQKHDQIITN
ncbi:LOW QUALITY PROTEIN: NAD-dependent protein deacylase-like [Paramacrobiotus metropolitanus]|uniref:LOW QUALITY PROTEIN: NAD-dependent protein deacylase-like n=1 Tax=Paramacrobiotus metropolitanus TaxID=2943436 RepID=UPI0024456B3B|nr:LOW QUALITY PROTEIN: NAD-dependent protein deacylase-like [Paramacrobiotus metropolitanus]